METILIRIEDKKEANLIKELLSKFQSVTSIGTSKNKHLNKIMEALEMDEDVKQYKAAKKEDETPISFNEVVKKWQAENML